MEERNQNTVCICDSQTPAHLACWNDGHLESFKTFQVKSRVVFGYDPILLTLTR